MLLSPHRLYTSALLTEGAGWSFNALQAQAALLGEDSHDERSKVGFVHVHSN